MQQMKYKGDCDHYYRHSCQLMFLKIPDFTWSCDVVNESHQVNGSRPHPVY